MNSEEPIAMRQMDDPSSDNSDSDSSDSRSTEPIRPKPTDLGKRVLYHSTAEQKHKYGVLRYVGEPEFAPGTWCGLELNTACGKNNGMLQGIRYFRCQPNYGVFVPIDKVELDQGRRSRSRPNSAPGSRSSSVDREVVTSRTGGHSLVASTGGQKSKTGKTFVIQQELATRLSQQTPIHKRKANPPVTNPTGRRQPLKAFATKGVSREERKDNKRFLTPFRSGGMVKAQSTENMRSLKDTKTAAGGMPAKKSSSERDLRNGSSTPIKQKPLSKKARVNSCSDLLSPVTSSKTKPRTRPVSDILSSSTKSTISLTPKPGKGQAIKFPRTSTPGNRDNTPDGCSSPDDLSDSGSNTSQEVKESVGVASTPSVGDTAFIETPEIPKNKLTDTTGLSTTTKQLIENERAFSSLDDPRVGSPDHGASKCFKNKPSGSATLTHPLTQHVVTESGKRDSLVVKLLDSNIPLEGVSMQDVVDLFREEHKQWHSKQVQLEKQTEQLRHELLQTRTTYKEETDKLKSKIQSQSEHHHKVEREHKTVVQQLVANHQQELIALHKAHRHEIEKLTDKHRHTTV